MEGDMVKQTSQDVWFQCMLWMGKDSKSKEKTFVGD